MFLSSRLLCVLTLAGLAIACASAADAPKDNPLGQAGTTATPAGNVNDLEFAGVATIGNRTTITLYDKVQKANISVDVGKTVGDITAEKYDSDQDEVTVRRNGVEKTLPLRPPSAVAAGNTAPLPAAPAMSAATPAATTPTSSLSPARQEEEARMLVSDLLEIGMAQRKAYEEAQRRAAAAQGQQPPQSPAAEPAGAATGAQPAAPAQPAEGQPAQSASTAATTPSGS